MLEQQVLLAHLDQAVHQGHQDQQALQAQLVLPAQEQPDLLVLQAQVVLLGL